MLSDWEHETLPVLARIIALEDRRARLAATRKRSLGHRVRWFFDTMIGFARRRRRPGPAVMQPQQRRLNPTHDQLAVGQVPGEI